MKTFQKVLALLIAAACVFAQSCDMKNTINITNNRTYGNAYDGKFLSDEGLQYNILNPEAFPDVLTDERSFLICNITAIENGVAEVSITGAHKSAVLQPVHVTKADTLNYIPLSLAQCWFAGGYLNFVVNHRALSAEHPINVEVGLLDSLCSTSKLHYELRLTDDSDSVVPYGDDAFKASTFISVPVYEELKDIRVADISIQWTSYKSAVKDSTALARYYDTATCYIGSVMVQPALLDTEN